LLLEKKFSNKKLTLKEEPRAFVPFTELKTLWFNTGTLCNLTCENCYIESSPTNDRLSFITVANVLPYLDEIRENNWSTQDIAFTGGEPFINPHFISILEETLKRGFNALVLTNAHKVFNAAKKETLIKLKDFYGEKLKLRVSMDHHTHEVHDKERGPDTLKTSLKAFKWLHEEGFSLSIAGRSLVIESQEEALLGYQKLLSDNNIELTLNSENLIIFPEMNDGLEVPEITTSCWEILGKTPEQQMCSSERMIVRHKETDQMAVQACTLLAYDEGFNLGKTLTDARQDVFLNHEFCAKFCVLGNSSCSG